MRKSNRLPGYLLTGMNALQEYCNTSADYYTEREICVTVDVSLYLLSYMQLAVVTFKKPAFKSHGFPM